MAPRYGSATTSIDHIRWHRHQFRSMSASGMASTQLQPRLPLAAIAENEEEHAVQRDLLAAARNADPPAGPANEPPPVQPQRPPSQQSTDSESPEEFFGLIK